MTRILTIIALLFATPAFSETQVVYCNSVVASGIIFEEGVGYRTTSYGPQRYTVKVTKNDKERTGTVQIGEKKFDCKYQRYEGILNCADENLEVFKYDPKSMRFSHYITNRFGWLKNMTDGNGSVHGTCEKF